MVFHQQRETLIQYQENLGLGKDARNFRGEAGMTTQLAADHYPKANRFFRNCTSWADAGALAAVQASVGDNLWPLYGVKIDGVFEAGTNTFPALCARLLGDHDRPCQDDPEIGNLWLRTGVGAAGNRDLKQMMGLQASLDSALNESIELRFFQDILDPVDYFSSLENRVGAPISTAANLDYVGAVDFTCLKCILCRHFFSGHSGFLA